MSDRGLNERVVCLYSLSTDLEGELRLIESEKERCRERDCTTLETLRVAGPSIDRAVITAKAHETVLVRFGYEPMPR